MKMMTHAEHCVDYILNSEREDFFENPSKNHVFYHAMAAFYDLDAANAVFKEAVEEQGLECIKCGKLMGEDQTEDYEYWPTHVECLGPYDAWIEVPNMSSAIYKKGFETYERAEEVIAEDFPHAKHTLIKKVRQ